MTSTTRKPQTITSPEFTCGNLIEATVSEKFVELRREEETGTLHGVYLQVRPNLMLKIGAIYREGTGWAAHYSGRGYTPLDTVGPTFRGDHFPTRTGKHTRTYAICYLIARAAGFSSGDATYNLKYEGVRA